MQPTPAQGHLKGPPYFSDNLRLSLPPHHIALHRQEIHEKIASTISFLEILLINYTFPKLAKDSPAWEFRLKPHT